VLILRANAVSVTENQTAVDGRLCETDSERNGPSYSLSGAALKLIPTVLFPEGQGHGRHYRH
jgi:hypothetical protein